MENILEQIKENKEKVPVHVAIIMDGNGRWAKKNGKERIYGHQEGIKSVKEVIKASIKSGVKYLTLYAFSKENWRRPKEEVDFLMDLLIRAIENELNELNSNGIKLHVIGDIESLPEKVKEKVKNALNVTKDNDTLNLVIALNYGARWEIAEMTKKIAEKVERGELNIKDINEETISLYLTTVGIPDPELMIRTSGEKRISNFLLWQIAYTELYFTEKFWPEFKEEDFYLAILDYQRRERRFGKISEQLKQDGK
jgi:undecaprenyl diphosphate synthase